MVKVSEELEFNDKTCLRATSIFKLIKEKVLTEHSGHKYSEHTQGLQGTTAFFMFCFVLAKKENNAYS